MAATDRLALIDLIHDAPLVIVMAVTGGGVGSISDLLSVPGASRTILEATVPYAASALSDLLGYSPEQAVAGDTANAMAEACFERAKRLAEEGTPIAGVACTAALVTDRQRRGDNRAHIAVATLEGVTSSNVALDKGLHDRATEDRIVSDAVLQIIATASKVA
ncbi:MAG: CinA family protein [Actinomycetota bacterium]|nr:CinA family protein [Actinomycetota bacterium]